MESNKRSLDSVSRKSRGKVSTVKSRGIVPREQKGKRKGKSLPTDTARALQQLASVVAQQHHTLTAMQATPLGTSLFKGRSDLGDLGDGVDRSIRAIKRMLNVEVKSMETGGATVSPAQTGASVDFTTLITQGDGDANRDGDSIKLVRLLLDLSAQPNSGGLVSQFVRVMIVRSHDEAVTPSQVINVDATAYTHVGLRNWDYKGQYTCLYDHTFEMDVYHPTHRKQLSFKLNSHTQFNAGTATVNNGAIQLLYWSTATTLLPSLTYQAALEFVDN